MAEKKFSELTTAAILGNDDIFALSQIDSGSLTSKKTTLTAIANHINTVVQYTNAYGTQAKTTAGAINELKQLISLIPQFSIEVVQELPTEDISDTTIYLVPAEDPEVGNYYEEYIHVNDSWELVGTTAVDLSAYYTKLEVDAKFSALATVATSGSYNDLLNKPTLDVNETTFTNPYTKKLVPSGAYTEKLRKIVGATVNWNQIIQNGNFADGTTGWGCYSPSHSSISASGGKLILTHTATSNRPYGVTASVNTTQGHNYVIRFRFTKKINDNDADTAVINVRFDGGTTKTLTVASGVSQNDVVNVAYIYNAENNNSSVFIGYTGNVGNPASNEEMFYLENVTLTDLTAMFNSPIADRAYTLEQAQAGSGIAWLQSYGFFLDAYNAYTAGGLQSVSLAEKKNASINLWNEKWEIGNYNTNTGEKGSGTTTIRSVDKISVKGGYTYYLKIPAIGIRIFRYNGNTFDGTEVIASSGKWVCPSNVNAITFQKGGTLTYDNDICINESNDSINGRYFPYFEPSEYPLDYTTLRGLLGLDANNNIVANGDEYTPDGGDAVKYAEEDMGSKSWTYGSTSGTYYAQFGNIKTNTLRALAEKYIFAGNTAPGDLSDGQFSVYNTNYVYVKDSASPTGKILYELATPTTATLTTYEKLQAIEQGGTEEFIDYGVQSGTRDVAIPAGNETAYGDNENMGKIINYMNT